jgi:hypothetical protein
MIVFGALIQEELVVKKAAVARSRRQQKPQETFTDLSIRIEHHDANVGAAVNHNVYAPQYAFRLDDRDPLYSYTIHLMLKGVATYPERRAGEAYELTIYGEDSPSHAYNLALKDVQERDEEYNSPKYRDYRGKRVPIYVAPKGLGHLQKVRREKRWSGWLFTPTRFARDLLLLLREARPLFLSLREYKEGRDYWIRDFSLQTTDPRDD